MNPGRINRRRAVRGRVVYRGQIQQIREIVAIETHAAEMAETARRIAETFGPHYFEREIEH